MCRDRPGAWLSIAIVAVVALTYGSMGVTLLWSRDLREYLSLENGVEASRPNDHGADA